MAHARGETRLIDQHAHESWVLGVLDVKPLDGDGAGETDGAELPAEMHRGHAAGCDYTHDGVAAGKKLPFDARGPEHR
jgi:hypothetical protein